MVSKKKLLLNKLYENEVGLDDEKRLKKSTNTAFILMFPCLILAGMAAFLSRSIAGSVLAVALGVYQFLMLKKFIEDYYKNR